MSFFTRLKNGWKLGIESLKIVKDNTNLLLFPLVSTAVLIVVTISFFGSLAAMFGFGGEFFENFFSNEYVGYFLLFGFYLVSYFIIVFFNVGLVYNVRRVFNGEEVSFSEGFRFSSSRTGTILSWAMLAATVGVVLKVLEDKLGAIGKIVTSLLGAAWSILIFFVVPVLAYEDVTPIEAIKRSGSIMKEKWGESIGANFGFSIFVFLGYILVVIPLGIALSFINPFMGIATGVMAALLLHTVVSAAENVFVAAVYQNLNDEPYGNFDSEILDSVFMPK